MRRALAALALLITFAAPGEAVIILGPHVRSIEINGGNDGALFHPGSQASFLFHDGVTNLPAIPNVEPGSDPRGACNAAASAWTSVSALGYTDAGITTTASAANDGVDLVTFANTPANASVTAGFAAVTLVFFNGSFAITDADVVFNPSVPFTTLGTSGFTDVRSVATHELGHAFGLAHSSVSTATMNAVVGGGSLAARTLTPDDVAAINHTYPTIPHVFSHGAISGTVARGPTPVYGAHVVARDFVTGVTVTSTLSRPDGTYLINGLPAGLYHVYVEPLDEPSVDSHVRTSFWVLGKDTSFQTTFFGGNAVPTLVTVGAGTVTPNVDLLITPLTPTLNLRRVGQPLSPAGSFSTTNGGFELLPGFSGYLALVGPNVDTIPDGAFSMPGTGVVLGPGSVNAGRLPGNVPFKVFPISVLADAPPGPRDVQLDSAGETVIYCGAVDVVPPAPPALAVPYGTGCMTSTGGTLRLVPIFGPPSLGNGMFSLFVVPTLPGALVTVLLSRHAGFVDLTLGCSLWVRADSLLFPPSTVQVVAAAAFTTIPFAVPAFPSLAGFTFHVQAFMLDSGAPLLFASSNGVKIVLN